MLFHGTHLQILEQTVEHLASSWQETIGNDQEIILRNEPRSLNIEDPITVLMQIRLTPLHTR